MENKLNEVEKCELIDDSNSYKYEIICYEDITEIKYIEKDSNKEWIEKSNYTLSSAEDIQICKKIIELREKDNKLI